MSVQATSPNPYLKREINVFLEKPKDILETPITHNFGLCERDSFGLFAEPLNVVTSFAFFIVAFLIFRTYFYNKEITSKKIYDIHFLTGCTFLIGIASVLFHSVPSYYTELADITFITVFIMVYFLSVMKRVANLNNFQIIIALMAFVGSTHIIVNMFPHALNDSVAYLSAMGALIFIAIYLNLKNRPSARNYLLASIVGVVSLFFRIIDNGVCDKIHTGTHFIWHSCNALLIYILMKQLVRSVNRRARMLRMAAEEYGL